MLKIRAVASHVSSVLNNDPVSGTPEVPNSLIVSFDCNTLARLLPILKEVPFVRGQPLCNEKAE